MGDVVGYFSPRTKWTVLRGPTEASEKALFGGDLAHEAFHQLQWHYSADPVKKFENYMEEWNGIWLSEGKTAPMRIAVVKKTRVLTTLLVTLREGRNRHIRRALAQVQLPVRRLRRIRIGPVRLGTLKKGDWRRLTSAEVAALRQDPVASGKHPKRPRGRQRGAAARRRNRERP